MAVFTKLQLELQMALSFGRQTVINFDKAEVTECSGLRE